MKPTQLTPSDFYFELNAKEDHIPFKEVEGISTEIALKHVLTEGENPFKYRVPSFPKTGHLVLKGGLAKKGSKLLEWCAANNNPKAGAPTDRSRAVLHLKNAQGKSLLEWTLFNAYPIANHIIGSSSRSNETAIEDLELGYSFFTLSRK